MASIRIFFHSPMNKELPHTFDSLLGLEDASFTLCLRLQNEVFSWNVDKGKKRVSPSLQVSL